MNLIGSLKENIFKYLNKLFIFFLIIVLAEIKTEAFLNGISDERSDLYKFLIHVRVNI